MPGDYGDLVLVALKAVELGIALTDVEDFALAIATACQEPVTINWVPSHLVDGRVVSVNLVNTFATLSWVPDFDILVFAASKDEGFLRVPVARFDVRAMLGEDKFLC